MSRALCCEGLCKAPATHAVRFVAPTIAPSSPIMLCEAHVAEAYELGARLGVVIDVEPMQLTFAFARVAVYRPDVEGIA